MVLLSMAVIQVGTSRTGIVGGWHGTLALEGEEWEVRDGGEGGLKAKGFIFFWLR